jgi:hypothetical protein
MTGSSKLDSRASRTIGQPFYYDSDRRLLSSARCNFLMVLGVISLAHSGQGDGQAGDRFGAGSSIADAVFYGSHSGNNGHHITMLQCVQSSLYFSAMVQTVCSG